MPINPKPPRKCTRPIASLPLVALAVMAAAALLFPIALAVAAVTGIIAA
jgi:hypothetical protein